MTRTLHILTKPEDSLARTMISFEKAPETTVETIDLTQGGADYQRLLEAIFAADSVQVW